MPTDGFEPWKSRATSVASEHVFLRFKSGRRHHTHFLLLGCPRSLRSLRAPLSAHGDEVAVRTVSKADGLARVAKTWGKTSRTLPSVASGVLGSEFTND